MSYINDYRARCYQAYNTTQWQHTHSSQNEDEYRFFCRISHRRFRQILPLDKGIKAIDVACGAGHFLYFLKQEGYTNMHGLDFSREMLTVAQNMGLQNLEQGDLFEYLPAHKGEFDLVIANDVIEHLKKDEVLHFLDLIHAALKPGGMVLISTLNAQSLLGARTVFIDFTHELGFTPVSLAQVLRVCSFVDIDIYGEVPVVHDLRSALRSLLWKITKGIVKLYLTIESGTGRGFKKQQQIFEPRMFATGKKV